MHVHGVHNGHRGRRSDVRIALGGFALLASVVAGCESGPLKDSVNSSDDLHRPRCGDGRCGAGETCSTCAADCGACSSADAGTCTGTGSATLAWDSVNALTLAGYKVYYGSAAPVATCPPANYANVIDVGNVTTFTVSSLPLCATYFFSVTAYDTGGAESCFSNGVSKPL